MGTLGAETVNRAATLLLATLAATNSGCGTDSNQTTSSGSSSSSSSSTSSGATTGGMQTPIREVYQRNPWGSPAENLLADGDFELSIDPGTGQYGWIGVDAGGSTQIPLVSETGGICRSGIRCALVPKGQSLLGRGTAAPNMMAHHASIFGKPATPPPAGTEPATVCKSIMQVSMISCDEGLIIRGLKPALAPGDDGYCEFTADVPGSKVSLCMYVTLLEDAILDNATLLPAPAVSTSIEPFELDTAQRDGARAAARYVRTHQRFDGPKVATPPAREDLR